jgi:nucleoside phosphorylase
MGPVKAGLITQRILKDYNPGTLVMLGIAASMSDDVRLGDVVIATQVDAYMENSKAEGKDEFSFSLGGEAYRSSADLTNYRNCHNKPKNSAVKRFN